MDWPFVAIKLRDEIRRHPRALARRRLIADRAGHPGATASAGLRVFARRPVGMIFADPAY
jgi:hypothetical protein